MDANGWGTAGPGRRELDRLDRVLALLAQPTRAGFDLGSATQRKELIERVWGLKRPLMRQMSAFDDPLPPCA